MSKLDVEGNGESLYFALENDTTLRGVNKLLCGRIIMNFQNGRVSSINHTIKPEASFTPPHLLKEEDTTLGGFRWREEERPDLTMIRAWRTPVIKREDEFNFFNEPDFRLPYPDEEEIRKRLEET